MASDREELLKRARTATILPMLSGMMNETFRIMADPDSSFGQLYDVVKYDQAISSKIISIANSPYYNRGTPVVSLERAMVMVGFKEIERIIMCLVFMKQIMTPWRLGQDDLAAIWEHSLTVAHAVKTLSAKTSLEESEKAFAISIVHDIGKIIFYTYDGGYRSLAKEAALGSRDVCDLERARYGIDHQEIGHLMSVKWGFPEGVLRGGQGPPQPARRESTGHRCREGRRRVRVRIGEIPAGERKNNPAERKRADRDRNRAHKTACRDIGHGERPNGSVSPFAARTSGAVIFASGSLRVLRFRFLCRGTPGEEVGHVEERICRAMDIRARRTDEMMLFREIHD